MKKMLIVEEPDSCETCTLRSYSNLMLMCTPLREAASDVECPLKTLPEKNTWDVTKNGHVTEFAEGYNTCLEDITGGTE